MGLAKHLKQSSIFYLPNADSSSSCLSDFQARISTKSIDQPFASCLNDTNEFILNPSSCAGISSLSDWTERVGPSSPIDTFCNADLTGLTRCSSCVEAGMGINAQLVSSYPNSTRCFYYAALYAAGIVNDYGPEDIRTAVCILGMPLSSAVSNNRSNNLSHRTLLKVIFATLGASMGVVIFVGLLVLYRNWDKKRKQNAFHDEYVRSVKARVLPNTGAKWFRVAELDEATNGFSQRNLIGQGAFGVVYKGILADGTIVAVKQLIDLESEGDEEFINEAEIISKIRHRNLLSLRGFCVTSDPINGKRRYLVYDFMSNGSLDDHLFNHKQSQTRSQLSWPQRKNIILDVAKGLAYLHYGIKPAIFHRDIKATNVLIDSEMKAKVADFGLAKQSSEGQSHLTTRVAGTYGYLAPEYALYGQLTEKSDVYSFGIIVLEIMSGRKVLDASNSSALLITDWAWNIMKRGNVQEIFDEGIREEGPKGVMERFVHVGILCAHVMVALRPSISEALKMLEGDIETPRLPDRPLPLSHESFRSSSSFRYSSSIWTSDQGSRASSSIKIV